MKSQDHENEMNWNEWHLIKKEITMFFFFFYINQYDDKIDSNDATRVQRNIEPFDFVIEIEIASDEPAIK